MQPITVVKEPKGLGPSENCVQCRKPTSTWIPIAFPDSHAPDGVLAAHSPLCQACAQKPTAATQEIAEAAAKPVECKRTGWSNHEVIRILSMEKISGTFSSLHPDIRNRNDGIDQVIQRFHDFERDPENPREYSAMAFNTHTRHLNHIGTMPPQ